MKKGWTKVKWEISKEDKEFFDKLNKEKKKKYGE